MKRDDTLNVIYKAFSGDIKLESQTVKYGKNIK